MYVRTYLLTYVRMYAYTYTRTHKHLQLINNIIKLRLLSDQLHQPTNGSGASFTRNLLLGIIVTVVVVGGVILALVIVIYKRRRISETPGRSFHGGRFV